jgi:hypothetical protein
MWRDFRKWLESGFNAVDFERETDPKFVENTRNPVFPPRKKCRAGSSKVLQLVVVFSVTLCLGRSRLAAASDVRTANPFLAVRSLSWRLLTASCTARLKCLL